MNLFMRFVICCLCGFCCQEQEQIFVVLALFFFFNSSLYFLLLFIFLFHNFWAQIVDIFSACCCVYATLVFVLTLEALEDLGIQYVGFQHYDPKSIYTLNAMIFAFIWNWVFRLTSFYSHRRSAFFTLCLRSSFMLMLFFASVVLIRLLLPLHSKTHPELFA